MGESQRSASGRDEHVLEGGGKNVAATSSSTQQRPEDLTRFGSRHTSVFVRISMCHALCRRRKQRRWPQAAGERQMVRDAHRRQRQRLRGDVAGDGVRVRRVHTVRLRRQTQQTHARREPSCAARRRLGSGAPNLAGLKSRSEWAMEGAFARPGGCAGGWVRRTRVLGSMGTHPPPVPS